MTAATKSVGRMARRRTSLWMISGALALICSPVGLILIVLLLIVILLASANQPAATAASAGPGAYNCATTQPTATTPLATTGSGGPYAPPGAYGGQVFTSQQIQIAGTITAVAKQMGITRRGAEIALAVAMQESQLDPAAVNGPWVGLYQQAPDLTSGLYTQYARTDPAGATRMFLEQLQHRVPAYDTDSRSNWQIGEVVQESGVGQNVQQLEPAATALAAVLYTGTPPAQAGLNCTTDTAGANADFDPGNIISDAVFYNTAAMTPDQIRDFIDQQGADCTSTWCLRHLRITTTSQPGDQYCQAYTGGTGEDAATVIAKFSTACGINPQVMLVTLQKESGLLSRTDTTAATYNAAWGWHCPDTGPDGSPNCDPAYAGFFNQGYGMAKQWARYRVDPGKYNYQAGQTVNILWNVAESGCGSAPVTIGNQATASLYNYTPYQPNAASLAAYPGLGDACSSYGNRNFFRLFQRYFGSTGGGKPVSVAVSASGPDVTIPNNEYVNAAVAGRTIKAPNAAVAQGLAAGFSALGMPYVWGGGGAGAGPNNGCSRGGGDYNSCGTEIGFDCSGLTAYVLANAGVPGIPGDSGSQRSAGTRIPWDQGQPGDIVGFPSHVAIYLGTIDGTRYILEASWVGAPIHVVPLTRTDHDDVLHRYW